MASGAGPQTVATVAGLLGPSLDNPEIGNILEILISNFIKIAGVKKIIQQN